MSSTSDNSPTLDGSGATISNNNSPHSSQSSSTGKISMCDDATVGVPGPPDSSTSLSSMNESRGPTLQQTPQIEVQSSSEVMPIAIVGMSCRFPGGANNLSSFCKVVAEGKSAWSEIPKERFNAKSFFHPVAERTTTMNVQSGHFLEGDQYSRFDAAFFNTSPNEAKAMDPRARMHLEGAYEALENAGMAISDVAGSDTAVFVGAFNADYGGIMAKDPGITPPYKVTGLGSSLFSNRISHWLDLKGPSNTVDTACSASMSALHLACQCLRNGDSKMAIASGANLILDPDIMLALSSFKFLSPDGRTYMFDQRANGYARGEGIATMVIKPLQDALDDNDPVHAVIRNIRTNQDGWTPGITLPSKEAQRVLIEETYREAGLDPGQTSFFEAHGTGTQAGDRVEAEALATALHTSSRSPNDPIHVGSIKTLMGHCEGASGVAGVFHATMALKMRSILPNCNFQFPSEQIKFDEWHLEVPVKAAKWNSRGVRQASINSFGYGGANVHVVLQESPTDDRRPALVGNSPNGHNLSTPVCKSQSKVLRLSANDREGVRRQADALSSYLQEHQDKHRLEDLVYTLSHRRSLLKYQIALRTSSVSQVQSELPKLTLKPEQRCENLKMAFIFTGQGAQWAQMGADLVDNNPVFRASFKTASFHVSSLGANWSMDEEIHRESQASRVNEPFISQTLCTALQLCLVDLLRSWGVTPKAVVGHSSGEIAAAYAAGMLSLEDAMTVAYFRGKLSSQMSRKTTNPTGGMLAVALSAEDASKQLQQLNVNNVSVACINSPRSVTLSGDVSALLHLESELDNQGLFNRRLKVNVAYHSSQMREIADEYLDSVRRITVRPRDPNVKFCSSVVPRISMETDDEYWVQNLLSPVRFCEAVNSMLSRQADREQRIDMCIELGPHSALAGPFKQICAEMSPELKPLYQATLVRGEKDCDALLGTACGLINNGSKIDLDPINFPYGVKDIRVLADLPSYSWNHSTKHWHEGRIAHNYLYREHAPHDILGTLADDSSDLDMRWNKYIKQSELPWLRDHVINSEVLLPAGAYIAAAMEAASQKAAIYDKPVRGYILRDVVFSKALTIPDNIDGVELSTLLGPVRHSSVTRSETWNEFQVHSYGPDRQAFEHCRGLINTACDPDFDFAVDDGRRLAETCKHESLRSALYEQWIAQAVSRGNDLGPSFQLISRALLKDQRVYCAIDPLDNAPEWADSLTLHAPLWDTFLQIACLAIAKDEVSGNGAIIPSSIGDILVSKSMLESTNAHLFAEGLTKTVGPRDILGKATIVTDCDRETKPLVQLKKVKFICLTNERVTLSADEDIEKLCWNEVWQKDINTLSRDDALIAWPIPETGSSEREHAAIIEKASWYCVRAAFETLSQGDVDNMPQHYQRYHEIMQKQYDSATHGKSVFETSDWMSREEKHIKAVLEEASAATVQGQMTIRVGRRLVDILCGKVDPLSLMLENDLLSRYYAESPGQDRVYLQAGRFAGLAAFQNPSMKILEIGGGTGGCTSWILKSLGGYGGKYPQFASYDFTDISTGFFEKARERFHEWGDRISYKALNIDEDLDLQLLGEGTYDMIIASNVLHATQALDKTLSRVKTLLKPGGKLVLVEITNVRLLNSSLPFAILPGWWLSTDDWRKDGPLITESQWDSLLSRTGFTGVDISMRNSLEEDLWDMTMMTSTKIADRPTNDADTLVLYDTEAEIASAKNLAVSLTESQGIECSVLSLRDVKYVDQKNVLLVDHAVGSLLVRMDDDTLSAVQRVFAGAHSVLWLTFGGGLNIGSAEAGLVPGFLRTMRSESDGMSFATLSMDLAPSAISEQVHNVISVFKDICLVPQADAPMRDLEFSLQNGHIKIPRLVEDVHSNKLLAMKSQGLSSELQNLWQDGNPLRLDMEHIGLLDTFRFVHDGKACSELAETEVEIETRAVGLNFHDLLVATGQLPDPNGLGVECAGVVRRVGKRVDHFRPGERVCAIATSCFATMVREDQTLVHTIPDDMDFRTAASIPSVFMTAYHSLHLAAKLEKGESILIHSAAGGVGQACIQMAQLIGASIFVTVGSPSKAKFIETKFGVSPERILNSRDLSFVAQLLRLTENRGVDVVVNSLAGDALHECWRQCLANFGRFIELGKKDAIENATLDMAPFERSVSYIAVGLDLFYACKPEVAAKVMREVFALFEQRVLKPLEPITTYAISEVEKAFRFMATGTHMGKIVVMLDGEDKVQAIPRPPPDPRLREDASYLISGGLGGIGSEIAKWMVNKLGARNIVLLSRSGMNAAGAPDLVKELQESGAKVHVGQCDVSDVEQLSNLLKQCDDKFPPIRGVVQCAMVLQDAILQNMTIPKYYTATKPKVDGSRNLHDVLGTPTSKSDKPSLDFFVQLSSIAGVLGNPSQSNYAAGNTFQDALAHERAAQSLPALTIDVGKVVDVGWVSRNREAVSHRVLATARDIKVKHLTDLIANHISDGTGQARNLEKLSPQVAIGLQGFPEWDARFAHVGASLAKRLSMVFKDPLQQDSKARSIAAQIAVIMESGSLTELQTVIMKAFKIKMTRLLSLDLEGIREEDSIAAHGVDSLVAVEIRNWVRKEVGVNMAVFDILNGKVTLKAVVARLAEELKASE